MSSTDPFRSNVATGESTADDPPPYTPNPAFNGETTLEQGPTRPFQPPPPSGWSHIQQHVLQNTNTNGPSPPSRTPSLFQQLTSSLTNIVAQIDQTKPGTGTQPTGQHAWSAYPGRQEYVSPQPPYVNPGPPIGSLAHTDTSSSSSANLISASGPSQPSDFHRDFYTAGSGENLITQYTPPLGQPPQMSSGSNASIPVDGKPTTYPVVGHPLLHEGKLLVYPRGYQCDKCAHVLPI